MDTRGNGNAPTRGGTPAGLDAYPTARVRLVLGAGSVVAAVRGARRVRPRHLPELRPTVGRLVPRRRARHPKGWTREGVRDVWTHRPTGLRFSGHMIAHYGWDAMPNLCVEIIGWRAYIAGLPTTDLAAERAALLAQAMAAKNDEDMRTLTVRWELMGEESTMGGTPNG